MRVIATASQKGGSGKTALIDALDARSQRDLLMQQVPADISGRPARDN